MNILFVASAKDKKSTGGHLHSLLHISRELSKVHYVKIISFGNETCELLDSSKMYLGYCNYKFYNIINIKKRIKLITKDFRPDIVNIYNDEIYLIFRFLILFPFAKLIYTKCGGMNPIRNKWVYADNLILFSKENYNWFMLNKNYKKSNIFLVPNRVGYVELYDDNIINIKKEENKFCFLRIGRISHSYINSYLKLIDLVSKLKKDNFDVHLYIIGVINESVYYDQIKQKLELSGIDYTIITDPDKINIASKYLYLGDCILGSGRSAMEAMSVSKPVLVPAMNSPFPILLKKNNFEFFLNMNFSERSIVSNKLIIENYSNLCSLITDSEFRENIKNESFYLFKEYLSLTSLNEKYNQIFANSTIKRTYSLYNFFYLIYLYIRYI